jgi:hypothetical protein
LKPASAKSKEGFKSYYLGSGSQGVEVHGVVEYLVSIEKILCNAQGKDAKIEVQAIDPDTNPNRKDTDPPNPDPPKITGNPITVTKKQPTASEVKNPILYFYAEPSFVSGEGDVKLSWSVVSPQNSPLKIKLRTPSNGSGEYVTSSSHTDHLRNNTFTYELEIEGHKDHKREATVNVLAKKGEWTEITPEKKSTSLSTFPSVIFHPQQTDEALYIINCGLLLLEDKKTTVTVTRGLYESADGITNWTLIDEAVPKGMESSPGLKLRNRLWLIGGSSADPDQKSDRIRYFDIDKKVWRSVELKYRSGGGFEKRMGHACVAIDEDRFWVMGGLGEFEALNDVWEFTIEEPKDGMPLSKIEALKLQGSQPNMPCWTPRCMFSAVYFSDSDDTSGTSETNKRTIWVFGGLDSPHGKAAGDIWTCGLPKKRGEGPVWTKRDWRDVRNSVGIGADVCGQSIFLVVQNREEDAPDKWTCASTTWRIPRELVTDSSITFDKKSGPALPLNWCGMQHSLTLVGFKNRLHLRCLHRNAMYGASISEVEKDRGAPLFVYIPS